MRREKDMIENEGSEAKVSRRGFIKGVSAAAAGAAALGLTGSPIAVEAGPVSEAKPFWMPEKWDYETDILVVGHGAAGCATVITACTENLGKVMVIDAAPVGEDGGTSSICGQIVMLPENADDAFVYQKELNGIYTVDDDVLRAWAEGVSDNKSWLESIGIGDMKESSVEVEFPDAPGADSIVIYTVQEGSEYSRFYLALKEVESALDFESMNNTRASKLVFNPETKEVHGVLAVTPDGEIAIKAHKGVVLCCGGFEFNEEMMKNYYSHAGVVPVGEGTPYNRGDGIRMCQDIGAALWHMSSFATVRYGAQACGKDNPSSLIRFSKKSFIYVGPDATRTGYEEWHNVSRHGKVLINGIWTNIYCPTPAYAIFDQDLFDVGSIITFQGRGWVSFHNDPPESNQEALDRGIILKADTIEELAGKINFDAEVLTETITNYNQYCVDQDDKDFGRGKGIKTGGPSGPWGAGQASPFELVPINPPYYALPLVATIINTQGGPKRNGRNEIVDLQDNPIPRLYSAGELGTIYGYCYNGGGNISDGLAGGRNAARNAGSLEYLA